VPLKAIIPQPFALPSQKAVTLDKRLRERVFVEEVKKTKKETINTLRFQCKKCGKDIDITKKMK